MKFLDGFGPDGQIADEEVLSLRREVAQGDEMLFVRIHGEKRCLAAVGVKGLPPRAEGEGRREGPVQPIGGGGGR